MRKAKKQLKTYFDEFLAKKPLDYRANICIIAIRQWGKS
jgi:hypothetical protein